MNRRFFVELGSYILVDLRKIVFWLSEHVLTLLFTITMLAIVLIMTLGTLHYTALSVLNYLKKSFDPDRWAAGWHLFFIAIIVAIIFGIRRKMFKH